tara:strand:- start:60 stop:482 length:423 start_codon:yes stop_codon:yes gene_type:complete
MSKKKFSETKVGKFLLDKGSNLFNVVGDVLPDNGVLGVVKNLIDKDDTMLQQDKETALELIKQDQIEMQEITKRWVADASAGWLQANVRPLTLIFFSVAYVVGWYAGYQLDSISGVLSLIVGAYFGSRGIEKVMGNNRHK